MESIYSDIIAMSIQKKVHASINTGVPVIKLSGGHQLLTQTL
ncbi:hypothetical protein [Clostridium butyricum]|nr:hypothetical protein [Clostridium butyricum]